VPVQCLSHLRAILREHGLIFSSGSLRWLLCEVGIVNVIDFVVNTQCLVCIPP